MTPDEFQSFVNGLSRAFTAANYTLWRERVRLPVSLVTKQGVKTLETEDAFKNDFETHHARLKDLGVTEIRRTVRSVEMLDSTQAVATYDTDVLRGDTLVFVPYTSSMLLSFEPADGWRCTSVLNALGHSPTHAPPGTKAINRTAENAKEIYQVHLDDVNQAMLQPNWGDLCDHVTMPCTIGTLDVQQKVETCAELTRVLGKYVENMRKLGMTDYIRLVQSARFTSATRIEGWHVTHMLRSGSHIVAPYKCEGILEFIDGVWRMSYGMSQTFTHVNGLISPEIIPRKIPDTTSK